jgi:hypothetical protein
MVRDVNNSSNTHEHYLLDIVAEKQIFNIQVVRGRRVVKQELRARAQGRTHLQIDT